MQTLMAFKSHEETYPRLKTPAPHPGQAQQRPTIIITLIINTQLSSVDVWPLFRKSRSAILCDAVGVFCPVEYDDLYGQNTRRLPTAIEQIKQNVEMFE